MILESQLNLDEILCMWVFLIGLMNTSFAKNINLNYTIVHNLLSRIRASEVITEY